MVVNEIEYVPKQKEMGTDLIIKDLREGWSDAMIKRVYRYTSDLLQPFPLSKKRIEQEAKRTDVIARCHSKKYLSIMRR